MVITAYGFLICSYNHRLPTVKQSLKTFVETPDVQGRPWDWGAAVVVASSFKYVGVQIFNNLTRALQQPTELNRPTNGTTSWKGWGLISFCMFVAESITSHNTVYGDCSAADRQALQQVVRTTQRIIGSSLPTISDIYNSRCRTRALCIMRDSAQSADRLHPLTHTSPASSGRKLSSIKARTTRVRTSFFLDAVRMINSVFYWSNFVPNHALKWQHYKLAVSCALYVKWQVTCNTLFVHILMYIIA